LRVSVHSSYQAQTQVPYLQLRQLEIYLVDKSLHGHLQITSLNYFPEPLLLLPDRFHLNEITLYGVTMTMTMTAYVLINFELGSEPMIVEELRRLTL